MLSQFVCVCGPPKNLILFTLRTNAGSRVRPFAQTLMRYMFETSSRSSPCTASCQSRRMCRDESVKDKLQRARFHAVTECQEQFRYDRWNCSTEHKNISFFEGSKGTC